jgi:hypothetical protein
MLKFAHIAIATLAIGAFAGESLAKQIKIGGRHSRAEIAQKCDAIGGTKVGTGSKSGGYGCWNIKKDTQVECDSKGRCTGWVPD